MRDIGNPNLLWLKGGLFLVLGIACAALLLLIAAPTVTAAILLALTIWAFCRAYYFAFYVIEHYVDARYRFSGLVSFARYALRKRQNSR